MLIAIDSNSLDWFDSTEAVIVCTGCSLKYFGVERVLKNRKDTVQFRYVSDNVLETMYVCDRNERLLYPLESTDYQIPVCLQRYIWVEDASVFDSLRLKSLIDYSIEKLADGSRASELRICDNHVAAAQDMPTKNATQSKTGIKKIRSKFRAKLLSNSFYDPLSGIVEEPVDFHFCHYIDRTSCIDNEGTVKIAIETLHTGPMRNCLIDMLNLPAKIKNSWLGGIYVEEGYNKQFERYLHFRFDTETERFLLFEWDTDISGDTLVIHEVRSDLTPTQECDMFLNGDMRMALYLALHRAHTFARMVNYSVSNNEPPVSTFSFETSSATGDHYWPGTSALPEKSEFNGSRFSKWNRNKSDKNCADDGSSCEGIEITEQVLARIGLGDTETYDRYPDSMPVIEIPDAPPAAPFTMHNLRLHDVQIVQGVA